LGETVELRFEIAELALLPGEYLLEIYLRDASSGKTVEHMPRNYPFEVVESAVYGGRQIDSWHGIFGLHVQTAVVRNPETAELPANRVA